MAVRKRQQNDREFLLEIGNVIKRPAMMKANLKGDEQNIAVLFFLYTLQGIPLGLAAAIPMILQNHGVSYRQQAEFSLVQWPFSLKLLWAPIVDSMYSSRIGRRKSWLIPTQYLIGAFMLLLSCYVEQWIGNDGAEPRIGLLTVLFFCLNFLAATQDIAVDGWALTMLKKRNVGHASTCNSVGQTTGFFFGYVLFLALESADFCNSYLRFEPDTIGLVTLQGFLFFWGCVFLITTTLVAIFKTETAINHDNEEEEQRHQHHGPAERDLKTAYHSLYNIVRLPSIRLLALILLTCKIGFSATDSVLSLKLVESGIPKEKLGLMAVPLVPLQILLPLILSKYTIGPRPLDIYLKAIPYRLGFGILAAALVWLTPILVQNHVIPLYYYILLLASYAMHQICVYSMFVSVMAFFARVSDPSVGGTYMTLLNTLCNLGGNWPQTLALWFIDPLTTRQCFLLNDDNQTITDHLCRDTIERELCTTNGGNCAITLDGFYVETAICTIIGFIWMSWGKHQIHKLQTLDENSWKIHNRNR